ncbi:MAG: zinc-binding dehydrogenase [Chloroflexota bacterium]
MTKRTVVFTGERQISIESSPVPEPAPEEVMVQTKLSAISAGTEMLVYRNQFPQDLSLDATIEGLGQAFAYPLTYGYTTVGEIIACGNNVSESYLHQRVFAFHPHCSHFTTTPDSVMQVPHDINAEDALFLANMETAINLIQDGKPILGEKVLVIGQGVVGLLVTAILATFPLESLTTVDTLEVRRTAATEAGAHQSVAPAALTDTDFDLVFELSGNPAALNTAIDRVGYGGRIVVGSWYGQKQASLNLGGHFHRNRVQIISSQVSTIAPELTARWDKARRFNVVWEMIRRFEPSRWISHRFAVESAAQAYQLLDMQPETTLQVVFTYS